MKRYDPEPDHYGGCDMCSAKMIECVDGDYVLFDEAERSAMCEADSNAVLGDVPNITDENIQELREIILDSGSSKNYQNKQIREWFVRHFA